MLLASGLLLWVTAWTQAEPLGRWVSTTDDLGGVTALAPRPDGGFIALDADRGVVRVFDANGTPGPVMTAQTVDPRGITTDGEHVFIADAGTDRVLVLGPGESSMLGEEAGLVLPSDVDVHGSLVAVADTGNDRIVLFDIDAGTWRAIGSRGSDHARFNAPAAVSFDADGGLWVADTHNHRVQHFDAGGQHVRSVGSWGSFPGQFIEPRGVDVDGARVVVADHLNHRIQVLDAESGSSIESWGMHAVKPRQGEGSVHYPEDVAVLSGGDVIVAEPFEERLQRFGPSGSPVKTPARPAPRATQSHFGPVAHCDGRFLVTWEPELRAIHLFDLHRTTPVRISTFGQPGDAPGEIGHISALLVDADRTRIAAVDAGNRRLHEWAFDPPPPDRPRFDPGMARLLGSRPLEVAGDGDLVWDETDIVHMRRGNADAVVIGGDEPPGGSPDIVDPVACDRVVLEDGARVAILDLAGPMVHRFGWPGAETPLALSELLTPADLAIAPDGSLLIVDRSGHEVVRYAPDGSVLARWGTRGIDHGEFWRPAAVVVDDQDRVIVLDHGNHRAQAFDLDGRWLMTFGTGRAWTPATVPFNHPLRAEPDREETP